jgi:hypothetical protein
VFLLMIALSIGAWTTRNSWWPRPKLTLTPVGALGFIEFHWDPDAVRGFGHGSLSVSDGGVLRQYPLDADQLNSGVLIYHPTSDRVIATIHAGDLRALTEYSRGKK